ncbi:hypothetical protein PLANTIT3_50469 [Plantibacter sp. T3]|nr:hypothetical protein PLANTIT3_50469 [Plantibacter sp. T3]
MVGSATARPCTSTRSAGRSSSPSMLRCWWTPRRHYPFDRLRVRDPFRTLSLSSLADRSPSWFLSLSKGTWVAVTLAIRWELSQADSTFLTSKPGLGSIESSGLKSRRHTSITPSTSSVPSSSSRPDAIRMPPESTSSEPAVNTRRTNTWHVQ